MAVSIPASTLEKFSTFGDLLRYLRRAGGLTQLELSVQVGYSHAQISRLEQNLRLPDIPTIEARFVPALGLEYEPKVVARLLELAANVRREDAPGPGLCPYKGLSYFDEADADLFVGREALTAKLTERVLFLASDAAPARTRFLAVVGASGSGKSSLVRAGLIPALRWNKKSSDWQIHILTPTARPLESLAATLTNENASMIATSTLMDDIARDPRSLQLFLKRQQPSENQAHALLVIDQFEELFALCRSEEERSSFINALLTAVSEAGGPVSAVITLRADFYAHCADHIQLREALATNQEYIGAMNEEELRRAIEEPARRGRWELEAGLADLLLHDVGHEPGALPLLSHALLETWQRRRGRTMTLSGYASSGGVRGAIAETAETVFTDQFTSEQRSIARRIFLRLTEFNDETSAADTRRRATFNELILKPEEASLTRAVLKALADARLIITSENSAEVAHEALIREWPTLRRWLEENREALRMHRQLTDAAQEWHELGRLPDMLFRGARLAQIREWAASHHDEMNEWERNFLNASIELNEREAREREEQRQRELEAIQRLADSERRRAEEQTRSAAQLHKRALHLTAAFIAALMMAFAALFFGRQAQAASRLATSRELAAASISNLDVDPERSVLLALEALDASYTIEAEDSLHRAVQASRIKLVVPAHEPGAALMVALSPDSNQFVTAAGDGVVKTWETATGKEILRLEGFYAAYSPDGKRLAVVIPNGTVRMIDLTTGKDIPLAGQVDARLTVAFSPDGARLATVTSNDVPKLWDASTGKERVAFSGHTDFISSAVFSPDGTRLLTASDDHTARVWDTSTGEPLLKLLDHPDWVVGAKYSPDGKQIATLSGHEAFLWDANSGARLFTLAGHKDSVYTVAFSPDGTQLATGGLDRKIIVWDARNGKELFRLSGHSGAVVEVAFSQDGERLISSSDDGTVRLWDVRPNREFLTLQMDHSAGQIALSRDGVYLAATDRNGAIRLWDAQSSKEVLTLSEPGSRVRDLAFSTDGKHVIAGGEDTKVRIWDISRNHEVTVLSGHTGAVNAIAITQNGQYLATASDDYTVKIWDIASSKISTTPLMTLQLPGFVYSVAFSADGTRLAAGIQDGTATIWETTTGRELQVLRGHTDYVTAMAFSPDQTRIATSSSDGSAKVWDASSGHELLGLHSHTGPVTAVAYSPDGRQIATASQDGSAKLWDASTGEELLTLLGDGTALSDILFNADGRLLATGGDHGVRVYLLQIDELIALAKTRVARSLTSEECQKYLHRTAASCTPTDVIPTTTPIPPTDQGRVCQVTNTAGLYDHSFNEVTFQGLQASHAIYGWDVRVLQSASQQDFARNIHEFLRADCDVIVGMFSMSDAIRSAAESNPHQKFMLPDFPYQPPINNVWSQIYAVDQAAFLAGYVAASTTVSNKVGVFGGVDVPAVTEFMDGFALGVEYYNQKNGTKVEVLGWDPEEHKGLFVGQWCCAAEGRQITQQLLDEGADIILPVAGTDVGAGALYAVRTHGNAYLIGVDTDWAETEPEYADVILTSVLKNLNISVLQTVQAVVKAEFTGGTHIGTLESGEVALAPFHRLDSLVSARVKADLERIRREIIAGKINTKP